MIRRSLIIAAAAVALSVLIHLLGLGFTFRVDGPERGAEPQSNAVPVGTTFEELAEDISEPIESEEAEAEEPPVEPPVEPEQADIPTSQAQIASSDPQQVVSPDFGDGQASEPETQQPLEPETVEAEIDPGESEQEDVTSPIPPSEVAEAPQPSETPSEVEPISPEVVEADTPEQLAALAPQEPVTPSAVPVVPLESEPVIPEAIAEPQTEAVPPVDEDSGSAQAVAQSIRPRTPSRRSEAVPDRLFDSARNFDSLRFPEQAVESPLATYRRKGVDSFAVANNSSQSSSRSGGNASSTNYAGRVLVHLNNAPTTYVPGRGHAQVFFEINPDGSLAWVNIVDSSGSPNIDRAAKAQVRSAAPFPKPPGGRSRKMSFYYRIN